MPKQDEIREPVSELAAPDDKLTPGSLTANSPALRWLDNFWYHYKWTVIVVVFFVTVFIVCATQMIARPHYDTSMVIACPYRMNNEERAAYEAVVNALCPEDFDKNGEKSINIIIYQIYSEEEYIAEKESLEAESMQFSINRQYNSDEYKNFNTYTMTGETSVYLISPYLYTMLRDGDRLKPLSELYPSGNLPTGAREDGFGIDIAETDFYRYNPAVQALPKGLILCVHRPTVAGGSSDEEVYANALDFFHAIADYEVVE